MSTKQNFPVAIGKHAHDYSKIPRKGKGTVIAKRILKKKKKVGGITLVLSFLTYYTAIVIKIVVYIETDAQIDRTE